MAPRPITQALLRELFVAFQTSFQQGLSGAPASQWSRIASRVPSSTKTTEYGWLGKWPKIREWIGDRKLNELAASSYAIKNKTYESTVDVDREDIEDDNLGLYGPMFQELGNAIQTFPDEMIFALLAAGFATKCFDGQYFFDDQHPVGDGVASNNMGGNGAPWFLMATKRPLKPLIYQDRRPFGFVALDKLDDPNVVMRNKFIYGTDGRMNVGFGFWQMAVASKQPLTRANYAAARAAMIGFKDDFGRPLGLVPDMLVVPASLEGAARKVVINQLGDAGETNEWAGTAEVLMSPYL